MVSTAQLSAAFVEALNGGDWTKAQDVLAGALAASGSAADVEAVLRADAVGEVLFNEHDLWPELADQLVARAEALPPREGAKVLGWIAALAALAPTALLVPKYDPKKLRGSFLDGVERNLERYRRWIGDASPDRRVAGAHVLAWCANVGADDAALLERAAMKEKATGALATELLALGVVRRRLGQPGDLRARAAKALGHANALVRVCAATAIALLGDELPAAAVEVLAAHLTNPVALPAAWQWRDRTSAQLAAAVLPWAKIADPIVAIRALAMVDLGQEILGAQWTIADALVALTWDARGRAIPPAGLVASELDEVERLVLESLARGKLGPLAPGVKRLNVARGSLAIREFLDAKSLEWRAIPVGPDERRWHFGRIQAAVALGELPIDAAASVVVESLGPDDAFWSATHWNATRVFVDLNTEKAAIVDLAAAICARLPAELVDRSLVALLDDRSRSSPDHGLAALVILRRGPDVPDALVPVVARGIEQPWWTNALQASIRSLPGPAREKLLATVKRTSIYARPFFAGVTP